MASTPCILKAVKAVLSLAHNADFESIEDVTVRAPLKARNLMMGRAIILDRASIPDDAALTALAKTFNGEEFL